MIVTLLEATNQNARAVSLPPGCISYIYIIYIYIYHIYTISYIYIPYIYRIIYIYHIYLCIPCIYHIYIYTIYRYVSYIYITQGIWLDGNWELFEDRDTNSCDFYIVRKKIGCQPQNCDLTSKIKYVYTVISHWDNPTWGWDWCFKVFQTDSQY